MSALPVVASGLILLFTGCASVSVRDVERTAGPVQRPSAFYVADFETAGGAWNVTSRSKTKAQFQRDTQNLLAEALVANLNSYIGPAQRVGSSKNVPPDGWLVTGRFIRV